MGAVCNPHIRIKRTFKRWVIELSVALVVGILAGSITYHALNKGDKSLKLSDKQDIAIEDEQVASTGEADTSEDTASQEEDFSNARVNKKNISPLFNSAPLEKNSENVASCRN